MPRKKQHLVPVSAAISREALRDLDLRVVASGMTRSQILRRAFEEFRTRHPRRAAA